LIDRYNDYSFWEGLTQNLVQRDIVEELGEREYLQMDPIKRWSITFEKSNLYDDEFIETALKIFD